MNRKYVATVEFSQFDPNSNFVKTTKNLEVNKNTTIGDITELIKIVVPKESYPSEFAIRTLDSLI